MGYFLTKIISHYALAFGVVIGAALLSGMAAIFTLQPPTLTMRDVATNVKVWAVVAAIGGTIDPIREIESNVIDSQYSPVIKQILYIVSSFIGAYTGAKLIEWICGGAK
ncbi:YtrH family sporulation protein [Longirhabdus pacifica]|uniref:YtrH family sporulation protein n=1 Tax=Longirhabdus pacifica TaxID=2305227 RepID=UPI001008EDA7|nr:YtrH family sporulation protein [Longirhabdus pacifica]